jgi:hypothetical protein
MTTQIKESKSTFINLKNQNFAKYFFIYRINDAYSINELSKFQSKNQLLFKKIQSKDQQLNLIIVDSIFSIILADVTLEVFLQNINTFKQYLSLKSKIKIVNENDESRFFNYKFYKFIHLLLYSNIASNNVFNEKEYFDRVYYLKNKLGVIEYFSIYEQTILQQRLLDSLNLKFDFALSSISNQEVKLCLKIFY